MKLTELASILSEPTSIYAKGKVKDKFIRIGNAGRLAKSTLDFDVVMATASAGRINVRLVGFDANAWADSLSSPE